MAPPEPRPRRAGLDVETQRRIIELYSHRTESLRSIAEKVFVSTSTVANILEANGIERRPVGGSRHRPTTRWLTTEQLLQAGELYATGMSMQAIADELGISRSTLRYRLARLGAQPRSRSDAVRLSWQQGRRSREGLFGR